MILEFDGRLNYLTDYDEQDVRLLVAVPCLVDNHPDQVYALLDTASEWCVLPPPLYESLGLTIAEDDGDVFLSTRFGRLRGRLERVLLTFDAVEGESLTLQATCFVSARWPGPMVIGWRGCLERMLFAVNSTSDSFYFAEGS